MEHNRHRFARYADDLIVPVKSKRTGERVMAYRLHKLGQYLRGWLGYFGISQYFRPVPELDEWMRRRIRMCYWKQWRWARTKIKNLLALG